MKVYNKLVRNNIPEIIKASGGKPFSHKIPCEEMGVWLKRKLSEEVQEYLADDNIEELADIFEVILAILDNMGVPFATFSQIRKKKADEKGSFSERILLESVIEHN